MIPAEWLQQRVEGTEPEELARRELQQMGIDPEDLARLLASPAVVRWRQKWTAFLEQMEPGDELWYFKSPPELWRSLAGAAGYAIVRNGVPVSVLSTWRSRAMCTPAARHQADEVLEYVAAIGSVALVNVLAGVVEFEIGSRLGDRAVIDARSARRCDRPVVMLDDRTVVGAIGSSHALVLYLHDPRPERVTVLDRVERACLLLKPMLHSAVRGTPPEPSGSATPAAAPLSARRVPRRRPS